MNLSQAIEHANALAMPTLFVDDSSLDDERARNEEAISLLSAAWMQADAGSEPFSYDLVRGLADRNRELCDTIGADTLRDVSGTNLARRLSDADLIRGVATLQHRDVAEVTRSAGPSARELAVAYTEAPVSGTVMGFDIETTSRDPDRGYIVNLGMAFMELAPDAVPHDTHAAFCGLPELYADTGVPLEDIHHITWENVAGKTPFRKDVRMQEAVLAAVKAFPVMAHNAAFEDSWLMLQLDGYAEARKAGEVVLVDTRDICRRIDVDGRALPRDSKPNALENWARRRGTLAADESERHLGLDDVILMLRTVQAEFALRNMFQTT